MAFDPNRWTIKTQEAFNAALEAARTASQPEGVVTPLLQKVGVDPRALRAAAEQRLARLPHSYGGSDPSLSRAMRDVVERADKVRTDLRDEYVSSEHLVLAMADLLGATEEELLQALQTVRGSHRVTSQNPEESYQALERYGRDLTEAARQGKID